MLVLDATLSGAGQGLYIVIISGFFEEHSRRYFKGRHTCGSSVANTVAAAAAAVVVLEDFVGHDGQIAIVGLGNRVCRSDSHVEACNHVDRLTVLCYTRSRSLGADCGNANEINIAQTRSN